MKSLFTYVFIFFLIFLGSVLADQKKVGFIYIGPPGDHGWTYMHDQGRQYMEDKLCLLYTSPSPRDRG